MSEENRPRIPRIITILALICLVIGLALLLRPLAPSYADQMRVAQEHAANLERTAAVKAYRKAAELRPDAPEPHLRLAEVYLEWGRTQEALIAAQRAEERIGADEPELRAEMEWAWISIYRSLGDWTAVIDHTERLLAVAPDDVEAFHALGEAHVHLQQWDEARSVYEDALSAHPDDELAHQWLGVLLVLEGNDPAGLPHLYAAETELAARLAEIVLEVDLLEQPAYAYARIGRVLFDRARWSLSARAFERALAHNPAYADAHIYLGFALDRLGRLEEGGEHLREGVRLTPGSVVGHIFLGLHHERRGDPAQARAEYETAYDLDSENPAICVAIGQTWAAEGRYVAAEVWLREAVDLEPDDPELWKTLARFYLDHHITTLGRAQQATEKLVELAPDDPVAHDLRGWAAFQDGRYDEALEYLQQARSLDPTLATAHYHLGRLWEAQGYEEKARGAYIRALDLDTTGALTARIEEAFQD